MDSAASTQPPPAELDRPQEEPKARLRGPSRKGFSGTQAPDGTISIAEGDLPETILHSVFSACDVRSCKCEQLREWGQAIAGFTSNAEGVSPALLCADC